MHWLRVILDEGHSLGRSTQTNRLAVLSAIRAERRWVMTGTPVPHTAQSRVSPLLPLFGFLRCQPYHGSRGGLTFDAAIRNPFEAGRAEGAPPPGPRQPALVLLFCCFRSPCTLRSRDATPPRFEYTPVIQQGCRMSFNPTSCMYHMRVLQERSD